MNISPAQKKRITWMLLAAGAFVLAEAWWSGPIEPARTQAGVRGDVRNDGRNDGRNSDRNPDRKVTTNTPAAATALNLQAWAGRSENNTLAAVPDLFAQARPAKPAAPVVAVAAPAVASAPRSAPAFPYTYMGGMLDDGVRTGFFIRGERLLRLRAGDVVDGAFRVETLGGSEMTLTYLPLGEPLRVAYGAAP